MSLASHILAHLPYLSELKRQASFTAAAKALHITQAAMSYQIKQLEQKLGCTLVIRRSGGPILFTHEGDVLVKEYQYCADRLKRTLEQINTGQSKAPLRLSAPVDLGSLLMPRVMAMLRNSDPSFEVALHISDSIVDLHGSEYDFAIRAFSTEHTHDEEVLYRSPLILLASPSYIESSRKPRSLSDLKRHTVLMRDANQSNSWNELLRANALPVLERELALSLGTTVALREAAIAGLGVALLPQFVVERELREGRLIQFLGAKTKHLEVCYRLARLPIKQLDLAAAAVKTAFDRMK